MNDYNFNNLGNGSDTTKASVRAAAVGRALAATADEVARAVLIAAQERPALLHALRYARLLRVEALRRALVILHDALFGKSFKVIGPIPIRAPLPDVAA